MFDYENCLVEKGPDDPDITVCQCDDCFLPLLDQYAIINTDCLTSNIKKFETLVIARKDQCFLKGPGTPGRLSGSFSDCRYHERLTPKYIDLCNMQYC